VHPADQTPQRPSRRRIGTAYRGYGSRALGGAEDDLQFGCDARAKDPMRVDGRLSW
jgi:hypothetical protein